MKEFLKKINFKSIFFSFVWVAVLVFIIDIVSKWAVQNSLHYDGNRVTLINNFLHITLAHNLGASFGMGSGGQIGMRIFWIVISVVLSGVLIFIFARYYKKFPNPHRIALALMIGGAIGNMIDRIFYWTPVVGFDGVIDWIDFQFGSTHFATFNIADSALVIGVIFLVIVEIIDIIKETREKSKRGDYDLPPLELEAKMKKEKEDAENQSK